VASGGTVLANGAVNVGGNVDLDGALTANAVVTAETIDVDATTGNLVVSATGSLDAAKLILPDGATFSIDNTLPQHVVEYDLDNVTLTHDIADAAGTHSGDTRVLANGGTVVLSGALSNTGRTEINGALLEADVSAGSLLVINGNATVTEGSGILQDPNGGTIDRQIGTGASQIMWAGPGGFSAKGADLTVNLTAPSGNPADPLLWSGHFNNGPLMFSDASATHNVNLTSNINLGLVSREVHVFDGGATVDAELSGDVAGGLSGNTLAKYGAGTLAVTGNNTYLADTEVFAGTLQVDDNAALGDASSKVIVHGGATMSSTDWDTGTRTIELVPGSAPPRR